MAVQDPERPSEISPTLVQMISPSEQRKCKHKKAVHCILRSLTPNSETAVSVPVNIRAVFPNPERRGRVPAGYTETMTGNGVADYADVALTLASAPCPPLLWRQVDRIALPSV